MKLFANVSVLAAALVSISCAVASPGASAAPDAPGPWSSLLQKLVDGRIRTPISAHYAWVPMSVTTQAMVGGPNMTFYGTTASINAALVKANPEYKAEDFVSHAYFAPLPKTAITPPKCNNWPESGSVDLFEEGYVELNKTGYTVNVPAKSCVPLSCEDGASIGLCNDNPHPIEKYVKDMMPYAEALVTYCMSSTGTVNGQIFDTENFNIVFDSGHCTVETGSNFDPPSGTEPNPLCGENPGEGSGSCPVGNGPTWTSGTASGTTTSGDGEPSAESSSEAIYKGSIPPGGPPGEAEPSHKATSTASHKTTSTTSAASSASTSLSCGEDGETCPMGMGPDPPCEEFNACPPGVGSNPAKASSDSSPSTDPNAGISTSAGAPGYHPDGPYAPGN